MHQYHNIDCVEYSRKKNLWSLLTILFIIPRTVLLSSVQPKVETLDFSTHALSRNLRKSSHHVNTNRDSVVKQSGNDIERCRSQKVLFQPNMRVFLQYNVNTLFLSCYCDLLFLGNILFCLFLFCCHSHEAVNFGTVPGFCLVIW